MLTYRYYVVHLQIGLPQVEGDYSSQGQHSAYVLYIFRQDTLRVGM